MRGHLVKRGKGSWSIVLDLPRDSATGKRRQQWVSVKGTKKDAEKRLAEILTQVDSGGFVKPSRLTVAEFLQQWLKDYAATNARSTTLVGYVRVIEGHLTPGLGQILLSHLQPQHIQKYYAAKLASGRRDGTGGLSTSSVRAHHRILREALSHAVQWGLVARNVADAVAAPRPRRPEMQALDAEGTRRLLAVTYGTPHYSLVYIAVHTGLRRSELLGLRWRDLDLDLLTLSVTQAYHHLNGGKGVFQEPKTAKARRLISLTPSSAHILRQHFHQQSTTAVLFGVKLTPETLVFSKADGSPLTPDAVTHAFAKIARRAGFTGLRLHDMRHTHATLMLQQGIHPKIVSERPGHANIQMTLDTYSHVLPGLQEAAALRFDEGLAPRQPAGVPIVSSR